MIGTWVRFLLLSFATATHGSNMSDNPGPEPQRVNAEVDRDAAEQFRRWAEDGRSVRERHREALEQTRREHEHGRQAAEADRAAAERARVAAEAARQETLATVRAIADLLSATLERMKAVEEMRRVYRNVSDVKNPLSS